MTSSLGPFMAEQCMDELRELVSESTLAPLLVIIVNQQQLSWPRYRSTLSTNWTGLMRVMEDEESTTEFSKALNNQSRGCLCSFSSLSTCYFRPQGTTFLRSGTEAVTLGMDIESGECLAQWVIFIYKPHTALLWWHNLLILATQNVV